MNETSEWFLIENISALDTPALVVYPQRIKQNIDLLLSIQPNRNLLRPHIKTSKIKEVAQLLLHEGITRFKCATIAEATMLAMAGAKDILLAYQPAGPKIQRLMDLQVNYPSVQFSCLVDNEKSAREIAKTAVANNLTFSVWIDLNIGMNRTGIHVSEANSLYNECSGMKGIKVTGLHAYDGHLNDTDILLRTHKCEEGFKPAAELFNLLKKENHEIQIAAGGSNTFPIYAKKDFVQAGPGTFVFWDHGYKKLLADLPFDYAALLVTRVISKIDEHKICLDLGHKSVAAEMPLPRIYFFNEPDAVQISQSEEHLVIRVEDAGKYEVGDVWYGAPMHICPSVALYESVAVIENKKFIGRWNVIARDRFI
jgi:D-serine deaminase-like pyridoxal phosphate-dependent protein